MGVYHRPLRANFSRYLFGVEYVGTYLNGWQHNKRSTVPSVEYIVQSAIMAYLHTQANKTSLCSNTNEWFRSLSITFDREELPLPFECQFKGSSRTDAGTHAFRNTFQVDLPNNKRNLPQHELGLIYSLNQHLWEHSNGTNANKCIIMSTETKRKLLYSNNVSITDCQLVDECFDARKSASGRTYMYRILVPPVVEVDNSNSKKKGHISETLTASAKNSFGNANIFQRHQAWKLRRALDVDAMRVASICLLGKHDFSSFRNAGCTARTPIRTISSLSIEVHNIESSDSRKFLLDEGKLITVTVTADAFLLRMVRNIVSVLVQAGYNRMSTNQVQEILEAKSRSSIDFLHPAPACGLYLLDVQYERSNTCNSRPPSSTQDGGSVQ